MPAVKTYTRVNFQNYPSTSTPLNATNLNKLDKGIDDLDDEVVTVKNAIENMSFDADSISYDNTSSGLQATDVQDAVDEINDNLSGFKYYPTGTGIVGLIADDSAYTDANGKYVIWGTATANQLVADNPNTYKSVPSTEETHGEVGADTVSPFNVKSDDTIEIAGHSALASGGSWTGNGEEYIIKNDGTKLTIVSGTISGDYLRVNKNDNRVTVTALVSGVYRVQGVKTNVTANSILINNLYQSRYTNVIYAGVDN